MAEVLGRQFRVGASITDISLRDADGETIVTGLTIDDAKGRQLIALTRNDLVFFTNGSLTQNATMGDTTTAAIFDRSTSNRGCFTLWRD